MNEPTIIIPAAGLARRMKSYGPKSAIKLSDNETLISRQLKIIQQTHPDCPVVVVLGFEAEKVYKLLPSSVTTVLNKNYATTNVAYSIHLGLQECRTESAIVVYGDLAFNHEAIMPFRIYGNSSLSVVEMKENEVGVTVVDGWATRFAYGLKNKWGQMLYMKGLELELFKKFSGLTNLNRYYGFEILNKVLEAGGQFEVTSPLPSAKVIDIDTSTDIEVAKDMFGESNESDVHIQQLWTILC